MTSEVVNGTAPDSTDTTVAMDTEGQEPLFQMPESEFRAVLERLISIIQDGFSGLNKTLEGTYVRTDVQEIKNKDYDKRISRIEKAGAWIIGILVLAIVAAVLRGLTL